MSKKAIYTEIFEQLRDGGELDKRAERINEARSYGQEYLYAWLSEVGFYYFVNETYFKRTTQMFSISLPSLRKFRALVENYIQVS